ncbi:MAG: 1-acyl-sn-glycerol-3-phosphate acyltransferase [Mollicutes bacterium]|nr:1-acyl-sn-glycerol-3-phosphate acyltransferase [Mollicutes bacterium]MCI7267979.1 1-acyl-sn-glycerol-3-phosphate acyltransferase [Mollicutes bacterium]MCI7527467.1 1-acyl-sn-glycerol-3-phosphate acyltransferase [Mollicutes bacterium]MDY5668717.1 1-acyl-sn-glycerol-3-phosphate acyltransferase [Candidatus Onthovivens sp.]
MSKIVFVCLSLISGFLIGFLAFPTLEVYYQILISIGFSIASLLALIILFFIVLFLLTIWEPLKKERTKQSKYYRKVLLFYNYFLFDLFNMKIEYSGLEKLKRDEKYMVISNHRSNLDSLLIDTYLKEFGLVFVAKKSLFKIPFVRRIIHGCNYIYLDRGDIKQECRAIKKGINILNDSNDPCSVGVFPEGTRTINKDYTLGEFKPGCFNLAKKTKCKIVLSCTRYTDLVNKGLLFKRHKVFYDIIGIIDYEEYKDMNTIELSKLCHDKIEEYLKERIK